MGQSPSSPAAAPSASAANNALTTPTIAAWAQQGAAASSGVAEQNAGAVDENAAAAGDADEHEDAATMSEVSERDYDDLPAFCTTPVMPRQPKKERIFTSPFKRGIVRW